MGNLKKTIRYFKRNGIINTCYAIQERLLSKKGVPYSYASISAEELQAQREQSRKLSNPPFISILVPAYETKEEYLREMIESCLNQTYGNFELIIADASQTDNPGNVARTYGDKRIKYVHLSENRGISGNTNAALELSDGEYCALLDHDDVLTPDALFENVMAIMEAKKAGITLEMIYSDEDKCDSEGKVFSDPHYKPDLNMDLLLSNNYICHFTLLRTELIKELGFRPAYDGSQDYDLFLRAVGKIVFENKIYSAERTERIAHIPKVLYHWRCHEASTAFDPASKEYAYSAGKRAIKDFVKEYYGNCEISELRHKGFYRVNWRNIFETRPEVGAYGGMISEKSKFVSGIFDENGNIVFSGLNVHFGGYMNRASLIQQVYALDIRNLVPAPAVSAEYNEIMSRLTDDADFDKVRSLSLEFAKILRDKGLVLLYDPANNR